MAVPIAPLAWTALRLGAVAAASFYVSRRTRPAPKHVWRERALDDTPEGVDFTHHRSAGETNAHGSARLRRVVRVGNGPGLEIDISTLGRVRFRRID